MAGSPLKRARKKARELEAAQGKEPATLSPPAAGTNPLPTPPAPLSAPPAEILPPEPPDVTQTAMKRAMRREAQQYAEKALATLADAMESPSPTVRVAAANAILDRAYGKPVQELEVGDGGLNIQIIKFGKETP